MLYRPSQINQTDDNTQNTQNNADETRQHGIYQHRNQQQHQQHPARHNAADETEQPQDRRSILLDVPPETLTSITSHLTPPALLSLGCVSSYLAHHVKEDNTWRRAYACHFLGISPESDIELGNATIFNSAGGISAPLPPAGWKTLLLRRDHGRNWRDEFSWRYVMIGRWSRSRSTPTTHTPIIHSPISNLHLMNIPSTSFSSLSQSASGSGSATAAQVTPSASTAETQPAAASNTLQLSTPTPYIYPSTRYGAPALLTSSIQYGVVARSMPLSGRVLTGYLDASAGARLGVGGGNLNVGAGGNPNLGIGAAMNGNPNVQFTPNVTACDVVASSPSAAASTVSSPSARVVWGTRSGELIFSTAPRAMDGTLRASGGGGVRVRRCRVGDEHEGVVRDVKWVSTGGDEGKGRWAVSAGDDGRVKLWDAGSVTNSNSNVNVDPGTGDGAVWCIWTSEPMLVDRYGSRVMELVAGGGVVPDKCVRVEASFSTIRGGVGAVVGVGESGDVRVWIGQASAFGVGASDGPNVNLNARIKETFVECPFKTVDGAAKRITALYIEPIYIQDGRKTMLVLLVAYEDDPLFYRVRVDVGARASSAGDDEENSQVEITPFGNPNFGPTSVVVPFFGKPLGHGGDQDTEMEASFVLVGDHIGCVSLYGWNAHSSTNTSAPILPLRTFEAHRDGASVTALWWDGLVLVTGSARGTTHVWDAITFGHLRSFVSPVGRVRGTGRGRLAGGALALGPHGPGGAGVLWGADAAAGGGGGMARGREAVRHIVVNPERDVLVVAVGDTVMAWHAGVVGRAAGGGGRGGVRGRHAPGTGVHGKKRAGAGVAKYVGQYEMRQTIAESRDLLDAERKGSGSSSLSLSRRVVEHRAGLDSLGLSETEAVEYVLMLSRDEAAAAERARMAEWEGNLDREEEGVFEGDFEESGLSEDNENENDDASLFGASPSISSAASSAPGSVSSFSSSSSSSSSSSTRARARAHTHTRLGMTIANRGPPRTPSGQPILGPSTSNEKVQISPPWRGEPKQAGEEYLADEAIVDASDDERVLEHYFPPIPGSTGTSPRDEEKVGKGKEKERKAGSPSASLKGKDKGKSESKSTKNVDVRTSSKIEAQSKVQTPPSATNLTSTPGGSPTSLKASAWSVPLKPKDTSGPTSFSAVAAAGAGSGPGRPSFGAGASAGSRVSQPAAAGIYRGEADDMDEDLRFALELSLVEARSRGEDV